MSREIPEADWKRFRKIRAVALERYCERTLSQLQALSRDDGTTAHERYMAVYKLIRERDRDLANAFDDVRRSTALIQCAIIVSYGLVTPQELEELTPETREVLRFLSKRRD